MPKLPSPPHLSQHMTDVLSTVTLILAGITLVWTVIVTIQLWRGRGMHILYRYNPRDHAWAWVVSFILTLSLAVLTWLVAG